MREALLALSVTLAGCSASADSDALSNMVVENLTAENLVLENTLADVEAPARPEPRYIEKDGDTYLYVAAVSEEEQKKGRAAGAIFGFRYLGKVDGMYRLAGPDGSSAIHECSQPCRVIKTRLASGIVTRTEFTPSSIIGAAFTDAFNGFLKPPRPPRAEPPALPYPHSAEAESGEAGASVNAPPLEAVENETITNTSEDY